MPDAEGYPTDEELQRLRDWDMADPRGWLDFARSLWHWADWGWPTPAVKSEEPIEVSTGGWSGNESIIEAMQQAHFGVLWHAVWEQTRKGGHYILSLPKGWGYDG